MGTPKFSLQNVLNIRHEKVELLEIEFGKLLMLHQETQNFMKSLEEYQVNLLDQLGKAQTGDIDLVEMNLLRMNITQINTHMELLNIQLKKQAIEIEVKRAQLVQAKQSEETLTILKRKRREVYDAEQIHIEAQTQDDIYIARAFRNQQQGV
jgi:flagellar export protein FliJ